jgi:hypothetical protein
MRSPLTPLRFEDLLCGPVREGPQLRLNSLAYFGQSLNQVFAAKHISSERFMLRLAEDFLVTSAHLKLLIRVDDCYLLARGSSKYYFEATFE